MRGFIWLAIAVFLFFAWIGSFIVYHVAGFLIHLLLIFALINFLVGTMALQIQSIMGVIRAKYFIVEFLSGLLLPLGFFPEKVRRVLLFLPFPHLSYTPLEIYLGRLRGVALVGNLALQVAWIAVLFAAGRLYWRLATRRLSIQGG